MDKETVRRTYRRTDISIYRVASLLKIVYKLFRRVFLGNLCCYGSITFPIHNENLDLVDYTTPHTFFTYFHVGFVAYFRLGKDKGVPHRYWATAVAKNVKHMYVVKSTLFSQINYYSSQSMYLLKSVLETDF